MPGSVCLIGAVRGLESEGQRVSRALAELRPDIIGLSLSREALDSLAHMPEGQHVDAAPANMEEEAYIRGLSAFGEVIKPPPCFTMAWKIGSDTGIRLEALDMDEEHFTAAYCKHVGTLDMMRQGRSQKLFSSYEFESTTPSEFVREWDGLVNRLGGYRALEEARESWMAKGIARLTESHGNVAAVIELERLDGVKAALAAAGIPCRIE